MRNSRVKFFAMVFLSLLWLNACSKTSNPEKSAEAFLESYYAHANLEKAKGVTSGLALQKVSDEIALGGGQKGAAEESKRQVSFSKKENIPGMAADETDSRKLMLFQINISREGAPEIHLLVRLTVEKESGTWKVVNFAES